MFSSRVSAQHNHRHHEAVCRCVRPFACGNVLSRTVSLLIKFAFMWDTHIILHIIREHTHNASPRTQNALCGFTIEGVGGHRSRSARTNCSPPPDSLAVHKHISCLEHIIYRLYVPSAAATTTQHVRTNRMCASAPLQK